ncbi:MAG: thioredoxin domain-containing protein [Planctomycetota bacterium]
MSDPAERPSNRLAQETSPYLLQHARNPVDWYPWGPEALERARTEDRPILLSVGYSACHWCHVMERESFEDEATAALMNQHFVNVKVDREERPDLDEIYMQATLALNDGHGGWPMNVFLTPDLEPFFAGTYFPPDDRRGMPSWRTVCSALGEAWRARREDVVRTGRALTGLLREGTARLAAGPLDADLIARATAELGRDYDPRWGGFGPAPKFPRAEAILLLLRRHHATGDARALEAATGTLRGMARGGIYDHLGGGFARYSTDARWLVPHFEKMLYDNAQLVVAYLAAYQVTHEALFRRVAQETLDYLLREMQSPEGGFYSATDADSEGVEGKFFVWTPAQLREALDEEAARRFAAYYDVREGGNWEGVSVLHTPRELEAVAADLGLEPGELRRSLEAARRALRAKREERVPPGLDDKQLTAWNGLALSALAAGYRVLGDERYLAAGRAAAAFLLERMVRPDGGLLRSYRAGRAHVDAVLEDYAYLGAGLLDLYEAGGDRRHIAAATVLAERMLQDFADEQGGAFYSTAVGHERLIVRYREGHDGATPNANAVAAQLLARLAVHLDQPDLRGVARAALAAYAGKIAEVPRAFCASLAALDLLERGPVELALVGPRDDPRTVALWRALNAHYEPNGVVAQGPGASGPDELPLLAHKPLGEGGAPALYRCAGYACQAPVSDPAQVTAALLRG